MAKIMTLEMLTYYDSKIKEHLKKADDELAAKITNLEKTVNAIEYNGEVVVEDIEE